MFERYTERARRVIFFGRYEAAQHGSTSYETEHLLLGLMREDQNTLEHFLRNSNTIESVRVEIEKQITSRPKTSTASDLTLSNECKRILAHSLDEAERLAHRSIGTEHLLLGMLREEACIASKVLSQFGLELETVRQEMARMLTPEQGVARKDPTRKQSLEMHNLSSFLWTSPSSLPVAGVVPNEETAKRIAEAVWHPRCSPEEGDTVTTQNTELKYGVWIVTGSHIHGNTQTTLAAFIQKSDGRILRIHQEKIDS